MEVLYIFLAEAARITVTSGVHSKLRKKRLRLLFSSVTERQHMLNFLPPVTSSPPSFSMFCYMTLTKSFSKRKRKSQGMKRCKGKFVPLQCVSLYSDLQTASIQNRDHVSVVETLHLLKMPGPLVGQEGNTEMLQPYQLLLPWGLAFWNFVTIFLSLWPALPFLLICLLTLSHQCISLNPLFVCVLGPKGLLHCRVRCECLWTC